MSSGTGHHLSRCWIMEIALLSRAQMREEDNLAQ